MATNRYLSPSAAPASGRADIPTDPGALPALDEEVWVIVRPEPGAAKPADDGEVPGCGALVCRLPGAPERDVPVPLKHTGVDADITAFMASVTVTQQFHNPYDQKIEAVYVFPLPRDAAVNGFVMTVGERRIRGIIRDRAEAQEIYDAAKAQGHVASLMTQERPNVFTQHVANIEPGREIDVEITYFQTLAYDDGWYEWVFPMVVGPRFNPPGYTGGVGAVGRGGRPGRSGQATEVAYLRPGERSGHDISLAVDVSAGVVIEQIECASHRIDVAHEASEQVRVTLRRDDSIPNKDFVLRYRVAGDRVKTALMAHREGGEGYFALMLVPPLELDELPRHPMEMVFCLDASGSMQGAPMKQSKDAVTHALSLLEPSDTFQVIRFSNDASQFGPGPIAATPENVARARQYVSGLRGSGGTMMIEGIKASLDFPHDPERLRFVTFLTDGYIGNERDILGAVHERVGASRIFSFGVGSSPNRYLTARMARLGRGVVAYLGLNDDGAAVMDAFFRRASRPALSDIEIDWGALGATDVLPGRAPDLFVGRPVILVGRFDGDGPAVVRVRGRAGEHLVETAIEVDPAASFEAPALGAVWARRFIAELADRATYDDDPEIPARIRSLALGHGLMSAYTSFVAVDSLTRTAGAHGTTVAVPVPVPEGVRYETTVSD